MTYAIVVDNANMTKVVLDYLRDGGVPLKWMPTDDGFQVFDLEEYDVEWMMKRIK